MELETTRLRIRPFLMEDCEELYQVLSDPAVMRYMEPPYTMEFTRQFISDCGLGDHPYIYALEEKESGHVIGHVIFHPFDSQSIYEIGWVIATACQGKGYATEASKELIRYGFDELHLHKIIAETIKENEASRHLLSKLGMTQEGTLREQVYEDGKWTDLIYYGLL